MKSFDAIVIGGGQAGPFLAARMVERGMKVALIERKFLGGTCVNAGCMMDIILLATPIIFFALCFAYTRACDRL